MFMSRESEVELSEEMAFMRATRSYLDWSKSVRVKVSRKSWESEEAILAVMCGREKACWV